MKKFGIIYLICPSKIWFEPMFFSGFFCGFDSCGSATFPDFRRGIFSEKCVRTNSRILHQKGKIKEFWFASLRSATNLYWILGVKTNWRFWKKKRKPFNPNHMKYVLYARINYLDASIGVRLEFKSRFARKFFRDERFSCEHRLEPPRSGGNAFGGIQNALAGPGGNGSPSPRLWRGRG